MLNLNGSNCGTFLECCDFILRWLFTLRFLKDFDLHNVVFVH